MKNILLIIANGPSALENKYGNQINKFNDIARINNYKTDNFKKFIGEKTTIWANGANKKLKPKLNPPNKILVFIPYEILNMKMEEVLERTPRRLKLDPSQYNLISKHKMKEYENISKIKRPTTGLNSILWGLENYDKVIIHGFDFFKAGMKEQYYDYWLLKKIANLKIRGIARKHNNIYEKKFVENLIKKQRVIKLSNYLKL